MQFFYNELLFKSWHPNINCYCNALFWFTAAVFIADSSYSAPTFRACQVRGAPKQCKLHFGVLKPSVNEQNFSSRLLRKPKWSAWTVKLSYTYSLCTSSTTLEILCKKKIAPTPPTPPTPMDSTGWKGNLLSKEIHSFLGMFWSFRTLTPMV